MECKRCGECCRRGGPALHDEDLGLLLDGTLTPEHLVTLRKGEPAWDPDAERLISLPEEMIKLAGRDGATGPCIFYGGDEIGCIIYAGRPLECRALKCWDTSEIKGLFLKNLLNRRAILAGAPNMLELVERHEEAFPVETFLAMGGKAQEDMAAAEARFRKRLAGSMGLGEEILRFLLGRALVELRPE